MKLEKRRRNFDLWNTGWLAVIGKRGKVVLKSISWILSSTFGAVVLFLFLR